MMNLKPVLLLVSVCVASNIFCSDANEGGLTTSAAASPTYLSKTAGKTSPTLPPAPPNSSTAGTHFWYGTARVVGGKSYTAIFNEKNTSGKLKGDLIADATTAIGDFNNATKERFKERNLLDPQNQEKIYNILKTAQALSNETSVQLELAKALAAEYNGLQKTALETIVTEHAIEKQPAFKREQEAAIALANSTYESKMTTILAFANHTATSKRYLHKKAGDLSDFTMQSEEHYTDIGSYSTLLDLVRQERAKK